MQTAEASLKYDVILLCCSKIKMFLQKNNNSQWVRVLFDINYNSNYDIRVNLLWMSLPINNLAFICYVVSFSKKVFTVKHWKLNSKYYVLASFYHFKIDKNWPPARETLYDTTFNFEQDKSFDHVYICYNHLIFKQNGNIQFYFYF